MKLYKDFKAEQEQLQQEAADKEFFQKDVVIIYEQSKTIRRVKSIVFTLLLLITVGAGICILMTKIY